LSAVGVVMKVGDFRVWPVSRSGWNNLFYLGAACLGEFIENYETGRVYDFRAYQDRIIAKNLLWKHGQIDAEKLFWLIASGERRRSSRVGWYILFNLCNQELDSYLATGLFQAFNEILFSRYELPMISSLWHPQLGSEQSFFHVKAIVFLRDLSLDNSTYQPKSLLTRSELWRYLVENRILFE